MQHVNFDCGSTRDFEALHRPFRSHPDLQRVSELVRSHTPLAMFLDIDGTLVEMALTPTTVHVRPDVPDILTALSKRMDGALAIVTGRQLADADKLLKPAKFAGAGVHGAQLRSEPDGEIQSLSPSFAPALKAAIQAVAEALPGVVFEDKGNGISLHYRLAPEHHAALLVVLQSLGQEYPAQFKICEGRKVVEVLPVGFSKGRALRRLAELPAFDNRVPIMIGDDIADADAFRTAEDLGGSGLKVAGEHFSQRESAFTGPNEVLLWLRNLANAF